MWLLAQKPMSGRLVRLVSRTSPTRAFALIWGKLLADAKRAGRGLSVMDGWIAAIALAHQLTLVTRNTRDFQNLGIALFDPWALPGDGSKEGK